MQGLWRRRLHSAALALALSGLMVAPALAASDVEIHYAPQENLSRFDTRLIDAAERSIDMAAYVLTDADVVEALRDAAVRGVAIRLYFDKSQYAQHGARTGALDELFSFPNVKARIKGRGVLMHLKAYAVDGVTLRTGSSNFSRSGLEAQDNDLVLVSDAAAVQDFEANFSALWSRGENTGAFVVGQAAR